MLRLFTGHCGHVYQWNRRHEKNLSAERTQAQTHPRIPRSHGYRQRPQSAVASSGQRPRPPGCLISITGRTVDGLCFSRSRRLLTPRDYKQVFDGASLKVSCKEVLILARPNQLGHARLGLVIAKRQVRQANQRNRIKRIARETFRHQLQLGGVDAVMLARGGLDRLENADLHRQLNQLWRQLQRKAAKTPE